MKSENIEKIANNLCLSKNSTSSGSAPSHKIDLPHYQSIYFSIFFDDINENNGSPTSADAFNDALVERITNKGNKIDEFEQELEIFRKTWNDWVYLYRELAKKDLLKS